MRRQRVPPPPKKEAKMARNRNGDFEGDDKWLKWLTWLKLAKALDRSNEIDEFGGHGQRVNLSKKLPEGWRKFK